MGSENSQTENTVPTAFFCDRLLTTLGHGPLSSVTAVGAWLVTMVIPSLGQEITAALVLAQMAPTADASLPVAAIKILLPPSSRVSVTLGTSVSHVETLEGKEASSYVS